MSFLISVCISISYLFVIISKKRWSILIGIFFIIIFLSIFFVSLYESFTLLGFLIPWCFLPMTVVTVLISIGIYLILLLLELIPKFRVPLSPVSQNSIFKKYIRIFYCFYFVIMCSFIYVIGLIIKYCA